MVPEGLQVRIAVGEDIAHCLAVRRAVFIDEQGIDEADEVDGEDDACRHLLAILDGTAVGAARLALRGAHLKVQRVAVLRAHRGSGIGEAIMRAAIAEARRTPGVTEVVLGAQTHALAFYERLGFSAHGPIYIDAGVDHQDMRLPLQRTTRSA